MVDKPQPNDSAAPSSPQAQPAAAAPGGPIPRRRPPGHRANDMRDTMAELAERAQLISQEAGSKVAAAMKDVISAGAGIAGFAIESARDLVQYMVKRGQMTADEGDKLIRAAEAAHDKRPASEKTRPTASKIAAEKAAVAKAEAAARAAAQAATVSPFRPLSRPALPPPPPAAPLPAAAKSTAAHNKKSEPVKLTKPSNPARATKTAKAPKPSKQAKPAKAKPASKPASKPAKVAKASSAKKGRR